MSEDCGDMREIAARVEQLGRERIREERDHYRQKYHELLAERGRVEEKKAAALAGRAREWLKDFEPDIHNLNFSSDDTIDLIRDFLALVEAEKAEPRECPDCGQPCGVKLLPDCTCRGRVEEKKAAFLEAAIACCKTTGTHGGRFLGMLEAYRALVEAEKAATRSARTPSQDG